MLLIQVIKLVFLVNIAFCLYIIQNFILMYMEKYHKQLVTESRYVAEPVN